MLTGSPLQDRIRVGVVHPQGGADPPGRTPPEEALQGAAGEAALHATNTTYAYLVIEVGDPGGCWVYLH